jgi:ATPase subunit of ABC transporter with duplicated ATPase domains
MSCEVTGLVGANGTGKSTLLRALAGQIRPSAGVVTTDAHLALLSQISRDQPGYVADGIGVADGLARLERITGGRGDSEDLDKADWQLPARIDAALARVGLAGLSPTLALSTLSGGQRAKVQLAAAWLTRPDILLLDEPTNNLDQDGRRAVHELMRDWPGALVVASHDRSLLEQVDRILALEGDQWRLFGGCWSDYVADRDARRQSAEAAFERADARVRQVQRARAEAEARLVRRARTGKALRQSGSNAKSLLDNMKSRSEATAARLSSQAERRLQNADEVRQAAQARRHAAAKLSVKATPADAPKGRVALGFEQVSFGYGPRKVLSNLNFTLLGGERCALRGPNGSGKTSVMGLAEGRLKPGSGQIRRGAGRVARLDQMVGDLDEDLDAVEALKARYKTLCDNDARAALAQFDLRGARVERPLVALSGGERLRVGLAGALGGEPPALLLLDEPTNHLDLEALEALEAALKDYRGTLLAVSHDEAFLAAIELDRELVLEPLKL